MGKWMDVLWILFLVVWVVWGMAREWPLFSERSGPSLASSAGALRAKHEGGFPEGRPQSVGSARGVGVDPSARSPEEWEALRHLKRLVASGSLEWSHLSHVLQSDASIGLKAAYLQAYGEIESPIRERSELGRSVLEFLLPLVTKPAPSPMEQEAVHKSLHLMQHLNHAGHFDEQLKRLYRETRAADLLKPLRDKHFKTEELKEMTPAVATEVIRESRDPKMVDAARALVETENMAPSDRQDLDKYIHQFGRSSDWRVESEDTKETMLMKINGVAMSDTPGKVGFVYEQWNTRYFAMIDEGIGEDVFRDLPNTSHELAYALWTEMDAAEKSRIEAKVLQQFAAHWGGQEDVFSRRKHALLTLAVSYIYLCESGLVPQACMTQLEDRASLAHRLAESYLSYVLLTADAAMLLGPAQHYVERIRGD